MYITISEVTCSCIVLWSSYMHAHLEFKLVETITLRKTPRRLQVLAEIVDFLDGLENRAVNGLPLAKSLGLTHLLLRLPVLWNRLLLSTLPEELSLFGLLGSFGGGEVCVVNGFGDGDGTELDFGGSSDNVGLVYTSHVDTVQSVIISIILLHGSPASDSLEWTGDEQ
jgi:hypothetical protein